MPERSVGKVRNKLPVGGNEAMRFRFLKESERLSEEEKEAYARLINIGSGEDGIYAMTEKVAAASLQTLSQLLVATMMRW